MTDLELKYYKALQGKFREAMGNEIVGDRFWCVYCQKQFTLFSNDNPSYYIDTLNGHGHAKGDPIFRLPLPIDPVNPERGLWGMVDWVNWHLETLVSGECCISANFSDQLYELTDTPALALLRAIAAQQGIEVEG